MQLFGLFLLFCSLSTYLKAVDNMLPLFFKKSSLTIVPLPNFLVMQHLQIPLLCVVNIQAYEPYLPKIKIRKLSSQPPLQTTCKGAGMYVTLSYSINSIVWKLDVEVSDLRKRTLILFSSERVEVASFVGTSDSDFL